ncbi:MAG: GntR family transcriptional regulator [Beijerinckiaceae bacterium]|nr:GntR family transcriptional regulator [Beijerinckiaceae bacterium]
MASSLKHRTLSSAIVEQLRQSILDGTHEAGTQLRQDFLAEQYGVSRIPVREALFQLEAEGLVRIIPHKGAVVSGLSLEEINDVFDLRLMLEPRLLAQSGPRLAAKDFERVDEMHAAFSAAIAARDTSQFGVLNARFHLALYARAELPRTEGIVAGLLQVSERYTRLQLATLPAMRRAESDHAHLRTLCREGAFAEACTFLRDHIEAVRGDLVRMVAEKLGMAGQKAEATAG